MTNKQGFTIEHRKGMLGTTILEKNKLSEIEEYIKKLEKENTTLKKENEVLENKTNELIQETDKLNHDNLEQAVKLLEAEDNLQFLQEHMPRSNELIQLKDFQEEINNKGGFSESYYMSDSDVEYIFNLGSEVTQEFLEGGNSNIPQENSSNTATLQFVGNSYEGSGSDSINIYTDYELRVNVYDDKGVIQSEFTLDEFAELQEPSRGMDDVFTLEDELEL